MSDLVIPKQTVERLLTALGKSESISQGMNYLSIDSDGEVQAFEREPSYCDFTSEWKVLNSRSQTLCNIGWTKYANAMLFNVG